MVAKWLDTFNYIYRSPDGRTWEDIADNFGIGRPAVRQRLKALRAALVEHPEFGLVLPRPTDEHGFRFKLTNLFVEPGETDIRSGHVDDNKHLLAMLRRMEFENETAYDKVVADEPAGRRSKKAKKLRARAGHLAAVIEMVDGDLGTVSTP
jgi:hypothetical protein